MKTPQEQAKEEVAEARAYLESLAEECRQRGWMFYDADTDTDTDG